VATVTVRNADDERWIRLLTRSKVLQVAVRKAESYSHRLHKVWVQIVLMHGGSPHRSALHLQHDPKAVLPARPVAGAALLTP